MSGKDVEMTDAEAKPQAPAVPEVDPVQLLVNDLRSSLVSLERAVSAKDQRLVGRVLRSIPSLRRRLTGPVLLRVMRQYVSDDTPNLSVFTAPLSGLGDAGASMEVEASAPAAARSAALPEIEVFLSMLAVILMLDKNRVDEAIAASTSLLERVRGMNRRTLDPLSAKVYFYYARSYELGNRLAEIRPVLLDLYRTACLHHSETGQATLLNLLLRNYLHFNLYDQAFKLVSKTAFPENRSNNQNARYLYYLGRIKAVQLEYSDAYAQLMQAARKAPQTAAARGFRVAVQKLTFIVQLLMGEIPERSGFEHPETRKQLRPYFMIAQAVRVGDLAAFHQVTSKFAAVFKLDNTLTLINRLRHNVIKTGLRRINVSYLRISLADVAAKLHLDSAADAECIVAKAIRDGVIDAVIDHEGGFVQSKETVDLYSTQEPQLAFHKRIAFCLNIHNDAVKAMTFPANAHKVELENAAERREREAQEAELAQSMADEDDDEVL